MAFDGQGGRNLRVFFFYSMISFFSSSSKRSHELSCRVVEQEKELEKLKKALSIAEARIAVYERTDWKNKRQQTKHQHVEEEVGEQEGLTEIQGQLIWERVHAGAGDDTKGSSVTVAIRVRPFNERETNEEPCVSIKGDTINISTTQGHESSFSFQFEYCFNMEVDQERVFAEVGIKVISKVFTGYNSCLFACE